MKGKILILKFKIFAIFFCVVFVLFGFNNLAHALTLAPALIKIEGDAGENFIQKITLYNDVNQKLILYPSLENFKPQQENGAPIYLGNSDENGAARWVKLDIDKLEINPGEKKDIVLNIKISELAEPGGHYAVLFWSDQPSTGAINTANRIAQVFFFKVKGDIKEDLQLINFVKKENNNVTNFDLELENVGNVDVAPSGQLKIFDWRYNQIGLEVINPLKLNILPQSKRLLNVDWVKKNNYIYGLFYAQAKIFYGDSNKELSSKLIKFWILPENFFSWLGGGVVVIILLFLFFLKISRGKI